MEQSPVLTEPAESAPRSHHLLVCSLQIFLQKKLYFSSPYMPYIPAVLSSLNWLPQIIISEKNKFWMASIYDFSLPLWYNSVAFAVTWIIFVVKVKAIRAYVSHDHCSFVCHRGSPGGFVERNNTTRRYCIQWHHMSFFFLLLLLPVTFFVSQPVSCVESAGRINSVACVWCYRLFENPVYKKNKVNFFLDQWSEALLCTGVKSGTARAHPVRPLPKSERRGASFSSSLCEEVYDPWRSAAISEINSLLRISSLRLFPQRVREINNN